MYVHSHIHFLCNKTKTVCSFHDLDNTNTINIVMLPPLNRIKQHCHDYTVHMCKKAEYNTVYIIIIAKVKPTVSSRKSVNHRL